MQTIEKVYSDEKSRAEVILDMYIPLFDRLEEHKNKSSYVEYCKKYVLSQSDSEEDIKNKEEVLIVEKIHRWYIPEIDKVQLKEFMNDMDFTIDELYDDPFYLFKIVDNE